MAGVLALAHVLIPATRREMNRRPKLAIQESKEVCSQLKKDVANILELANSLADDFKVLQQTSS